MRIRALLGAVLLASGCAVQAPHPDAFTFAVMGDTQYNEAEEAEFTRMMRRIDGADLAFVVHVGDFVGGTQRCSDEMFARRRAEYDASAHPFLYVPGDNEWVDCRAPERGGHDPLERLARLRELFFADRFSLGRRRIETFVQSQCVTPALGGCACGPLPENRFWTRAGVRFVTLNVAGSQNNRGRDKAWEEDAGCRDEANRQWLAQAVNASARSETRALVIVFHANPWDFGARPYRALVRQLADAARTLRKPVLVVHGDTHIQRVDTPFADSLGNTILNLTRLETYGSPFLGWIEVDVDPDDPQVFRFRPKLQRLVGP